MYLLTFILIGFLIDNIYVNFGDSIFRQTIGIPMGTNCAPLLANLYLFYYEYKFLEQLQKGKNFHSKHFKFTFRFIDDLLSINNKHFREYISQIYPGDLELTLSVPYYSKSFPSIAIFIAQILPYKGKCEVLVCM